MAHDIAAKWRGVVEITRLNKPIGSYLLLWPTYWALWVAAGGFPGLELLVIFTLGVFVMRSAGCVINDFADRKVDGQVARTKERPLITGLLSEKDALALFGFLLGIALALVLSLSWFTIQLSFIALALATAYPFMKRYTHLPQVVLGAAFSWGMIMAFGELEGRVPTVAYDTMYAMVDRDDDVKIGVKSTAILFGRFDKRIIGLLQVLTLALLVQVGEMLAMGWPYHLSLVICGGLFCYQQMLISSRKRELCFQAFLNNHLVGLVIFTGFFIEYL